MSFYFYKLTLSYHGGQFRGWQKQKQGERTVQEEVEKALAQIDGNSGQQVLASGRTDAGVHACGQQIKMQTYRHWEGPRLLHAMNAHLPDDIRILKAVPCPKDYHPLRDTAAKEYHYRFACREALPLENPFVVAVSSHLEDKIEVMQKVCAQYIGVHDFKDFMCVGTPVRTTQREIFHAQLSREQWPLTHQYYWNFKVIGSGFLKQMVRLMVGAMWGVASGKTSEEALALSLERPQGIRLGVVAPARGLCLFQVYESLPL